MLDEAGALVVAAELGLERSELRWRAQTALAIASSSKLTHQLAVNEFFTRLAHEARGANGELARWWGERCRAAASPGAIRALNETNSLIDVRALLPAIRVPTLVVNRGTDYDVRVEEGRYIAERIPGARLAVIPGGAHLANVEQPERFNSELVQHL